MTGFPRFPHARCDRIGCPLYPGTSGARTGRRYRQPAASRLPAAWVLLPRPYRHLSGDAHNEASTRVQAIHPPGLPLARRPGMTPGPLRLFPRAPHPREQDPRTHARAGTGYWTLARNYAADLQRSTLQSASSLKRVRPRVAQSACAFPTISSAVLVRASSAASFSFSFRSRSFSASAAVRAGRPGLLLRDCLPGRGVADPAPFGNARGVYAFPAQERGPVAGAFRVLVLLENPELVFRGESPALRPGPRPVGCGHGSILPGPGGDHICDRHRHVWLIPSRPACALRTDIYRFILSHTSLAERGMAVPKKVRNRPSIWPPL